MGEVYRARDTRLARDVALKVLPEEFARDPERLRRFEGEARAAAALADPHIVAIYDVGEENELHFFASELVEGSDLRHLLDGGALPIRKTLDLAGQIASGLAAAHEKGIVHRDLKPENILITKSGLAKIADFGLAKLAEPGGKSVSQLPTSDGHPTSAGVVMGTVGYMSPEQVRGQPVDHRSDIFSFGTVLYEMLTGRRPFARETAVETMSAILKDDPPELSESAAHLPAAIAHVVEHCLEKTPERRFQSAHDVVFALREIETLSSGATPELPSGRRRRTESPGGSARRFVWPAASVALLAIAASLFLFVRRAPALTEKDTILLADVVNTTGDPVFDGTLKQALAVTLGQSPYLNICPDTKVRETLGLMNRPPDERVTSDVAREICERQGFKAMLVGSIASLGSHYVITLEASNARTGESLARAQGEAPSKEQVLTTIDGAATALRKHLGESLPSIRTYDVPLAHATTSSLEALKAYSLGRKESLTGRFAESIPSFRRAIELDPNFAAAYNGLSVSYSNMGDGTGEDIRCASRAFDLGDRATERERLGIRSTYYMTVTGEIEKWIATNESFVRTYPREVSPRNNLGYAYVLVGDYEKAVEQLTEGLRLDSDVMVLYNNLAAAYLALGRFDEAHAIFAQARARKLDSGWVHLNEFQMAFMRNDRAAAQREIDWADGRQPEEMHFLREQAFTEIFEGRFRKAEQTVRHEVEMARAQDSPPEAANTLGMASVEYALAGDCGRANRDAESALDKIGNTPIAVAQDAVGNAALAFALCGNSPRAEALAADLARRRPEDSSVEAIDVPLTRAAIQAERGHPEEALLLLQKPRRFEMGPIAALWPQYSRGTAFLRQGLAKEAAAQFRVIVDHRSIAPTGIVFPLAHLGLARAAALAGDSAGSRRSYQDFFVLWKDADPDIPVLREARREFAQK